MAWRGSRCSPALGGAGGATAFAGAARASDSPSARLWRRGRLRRRGAASRPPLQPPHRPGRQRFRPRCSRARHSAGEVGSRTFSVRRSCNLRSEAGSAVQLQQCFLEGRQQVKACCTAPSLNPNMTPQKNKARPKRPQFFLPGLLKVALLPGHWCAWNRRRVDPPKS